MVQKHSNDLVKPTGGKKGSSRKTRRYELGSEPTLTILSKEDFRVRERVYGRNYKIRLKEARFANVADPKSNKVQKAEILAVISNPTNAEFDKRKIITKGAIIKTSIGEAVITSRPGQDGIINAKLLIK
ncbi:MAG: 30S ribosomal protein S8e [Thermoproteota archaeon]|jgi:small subunit ribosomal protein S8e|nr:30S ribosomal protein S8e [Thermoproteota archaeon]